MREHLSPAQLQFKYIHLFKPGPIQAPISIHFEAVSLSILLQPVQVLLPIRVTSEYRLPLIATADHMIKCASELYSRLTRNDRLLAQSAKITQYASLTPIQ